MGHGWHQQVNHPMPSQLAGRMSCTFPWHMCDIACNCVVTYWQQFQSLRLELGCTYLGRSIADLVQHDHWYVFAPGFTHWAEVDMSVTKSARHCSGVGSFRSGIRQALCFRSRIMQAYSTWWHTKSYLPVCAIDEATEFDLWEHRSFACGFLHIPTMNLPA